MNVFGGITLMDFDIELLPVGCVFEVNYFGKLVSKTAMPAILIFLIIIIGNIASRVCKGKFILDLCNSTAFFLVFLLYPSASIAVFQFFTCEFLNGVGETGYKYLFMDFSVGACQSHRSSEQRAHHSHAPFATTTIAPSLHRTRSRTDASSRDVLS